MESSLSNRKNLLKNEIIIWAPIQVSHCCFVHRGRQIKPKRRGERHVGVLRMELGLNCTWIGRQIPASRCGAFERLGTDTTEIGMPAGSVVEDLDIIEDVGSGEVSGFVDAFSDTLLFQAAEE